MEKVKLYNRIAVIRQSNRLSRKELAELLAVNYQTVGYLEREDYMPSLALAFKISEVFKLPIEKIFSTTPFPPITD